jgi:hypothetical protein
VISIQSNAGGNINVDLYNTPKKVDIHGYGSTSIESLSLTSAEGLNINIPEMNTIGGGDLAAYWTSSNLDLEASLDIYFSLNINTDIYGIWTANGNLNGAITLDASWTAGESGNAILTVTRTGHMSSLIITHEDVTLTLGNLELKTGSMTFTWNRGDIGYIQIQNTITATLNSFRLQKGTIFDLSIGTLSLNPGTGKISWDKTGRKIEIINGILNIQPLTLILHHDDLDISLSIINIKENSQPITIRWYIDAGGINGVGIDTNNVELAEWINFQVEQGSKGVRIYVNGLKANNFEMHNTYGQWRFSGTLQIASSLTIGLKWNGIWHEVALTWDTQSSTKYIKMNCNFGEDVTIRLHSFYINDWSFVSLATIDANAYMKIDWHLSSLYNHIRFDTANKPIGSVTFEATKDTTYGVKISASVLKASNAAVTWNSWPPFGITWSGTLDFITLDLVEARWYGTWYQIYP